MDNDAFAKVLFRGRSISSTNSDVISTITFDSTTTAVTEISITIEDPMFAMLKSGIFDIGTPVTYGSTKLAVAVLATNAGGGSGGIEVKCRPRGINKLKKLRGKFVMANSSPSAYVMAECNEAGVDCIAQPSNKKVRIARDTPQKGQDYDETNYPSAWTTFQRLANEYGYLMYESGGTVYFGQPTWLADRNPTVVVNWYDDNGTEPYDVPQFRQSVDSEDVEVTLNLPLKRADDVAPGYPITIKGFPVFAGTYLITGVNYPLAGPGTIAVTASTVRNPDAQKSGDEKDD